MSSTLNLRATRVWLILAAAAVLSWTLSESASAVRLGTSAVILIAAIKIRLVVIYFMELGWRPRPWRLVFEFWMFGVTAIILGGYWITEF